MHNKCIKKFFNTKTIPVINIDDNFLNEMVIEATTKGYTVPGVQKKLSLFLDNQTDKFKVTLNYNGSYILKPPVTDYECMPEAEYLVMKMAEAVGIRTVPNALLKYKNSYAYITKRIDRVNNEKLAMEDFCQLDFRLTKDKYLGSYERCYTILEKHSSLLKFDTVEMYIRIIFSYIIGNSDMHLKNFSLIEDNNKYILSKAYDLLPLNILLPEDNEEMALCINGKKNNLTKNDFLKYAAYCYIEKRIALKLINNIVNKKDLLLTMIKDSLINDELKVTFINLMKKRISNLI